MRLSKCWCKSFVPTCIGADRGVFSIKARVTRCLRIGDASHPWAELRPWARSKLLNACAPDSIDERAINLLRAAAPGNPMQAGPGQSIPGQDGCGCGDVRSSPGSSEATASARSRGGSAGGAAAGCAGRSTGSGTPAGGGLLDAAAAADCSSGAGGAGAGEALGPGFCSRGAGGSGAGAALGPGLSAAQALQNCELALNAARAAGCSLSTVAAQDVARGSEAAISECLWQFIRLGVLQVAFPLNPKYPTLPPLLGRHTLGV